MQNPNTRHIDQVLTNISQKYPNQEFIWPQVLPLVSVQNESDVYFTYDVKERLRLVANGGLRPERAQTQEVSYRESTATYQCMEYAFADFVSDSEQAKADSPLDPLADKTEDLTEEWYRHEEKRCADVVFAAATYPSGQKTQLSSTTQWSHADSDPITAILTGRKACHGKKPNVLIINEDVELALMKHAKVLSRLTGGAYTGNPANVTLEDLATLCRVEKVLVGTAEYDSTDKRSAVTRASMWGKHALLAYVEPKPGLKKLSLGYTYAWKFYGKPTRVRKVRDDLRGSGGYEIIVEGSVDRRVICTDVAYFFEDAVA